MRRGSRLALICVLAFTTLAASRAPFWTPSQAQVSRLETLVRPTTRMDPLSSYDRAYAGTTVSGRRMVEGRWVRRPWSGSPRNTDPRIVAFGELPDIADGGCSVVTVMYDVKTDQIAFLECNGRG